MNPLIVYDSMTGNVKRFISKLEYKSILIEEDLMVNQPYILVTYTIGRGNIPPSTQKFLNKNNQFLFGVAVSGNKNWGSFYGKAGDLISLRYNIPMIHKFELSGTEKDVIIFKQEVERLVNNYSKMDSV